MLAAVTHGAVAAPPKAAAPAAPAVHADRIVTPEGAAIRAALRRAKADGLFAGKAEAAAITAYYAAQGYVPSWTADGHLTDRARAVIRRIAAAAGDGLDPAAYPVPLPGLGAYVPVAPATLARADILLSRTVAAYAGDASTGRLDPKAISDNFGYDIKRPDAATALSTVAGADDPAAALAAFNPPQKEFAALRAKLAELRAAKKEAPPEVPTGPALKPGMSDPRIVVLRERLGLPADAAAPEVYDDTVVEAVKAYQASQKLKADGIVGNATLAALNRAGTDQVATILVNMERWRWMPRDLGRFYVRVNIPEFAVRIYDKDVVVHETRVVVGKTANQTPVFSDEIEHVVVNPVWNVPASIALKEMLPAIRANGGNVRGYQVYARIKGRFRAVDPRMINWRTVDMRDIQIKQPPGERNALGSIKFMFPNQYAVYLHDTPSKSLFQRDSRAFSHGCVRVMDPWAFADALLSHDPGWNAARLKKLVGGPERRVDLPHGIPVHLTYFTAWVDDAGNLEFRDDVYGHDKRMAKALGL
jgi:murein L,D-transpeptidase YcbB/YkuD